jgi:hypothetical protein
MAGPRRRPGVDRRPIPAGVSIYAQGFRVDLPTTTVIDIVPLNALEQLFGDC